jgi:hypothetical protein
MEQRIEARRSTMSSAEAPGPGHNSRAADIKRTAAEILEAADRARAIAFDPASQSGSVRLEYLRKWTDPKYPPVVRNLNAAALSPDVTGDEFKKMYIVSRIGGGKAEGIELDNETLAILMHTDARGWRKAKKNIAAKHWLSERPTSKGGKQHVNAYTLQNPLQRFTENLDLADCKLREGQTNPPKEALGGSDEPPQNGFWEGPTVSFGGVRSTPLPGDPGKKEHTAHLRNGRDEGACESNGQKIPFERFWTPYPEKRGKQRAKKIWRGLTVEDQRAAIEAIPRYLQSDKPKRGFVQQGDTYLSKRTWEDEGVAGAQNDVEARVRELAEAPIGKTVLGDLGRERGMRELRRIAEEQLAGRAAA